MEFEWDNPVIWGITIVATFVIAISIWRFGASLGWDNMPMMTRVMITALTPPVAFFVAQMAANRGG